MLLSQELVPAWVRSIEGGRRPDEVPWALSYAQKRWLERAWKSEFGFVPEAIPRYTEERGFFYVPAIKIHWHHIRGVAISVYYDGVDPHQPRNIVPLSARSHIGKGMRLGEDDDEEVIHESAFVNDLLVIVLSQPHPFADVRPGRKRHDVSWLMRINSIIVDTNGNSPNMMPVNFYRRYIKKSPFLSISGYCLGHKAKFTFPSPLQPSFLDITQGPRNLVRASSPLNTPNPGWYELPA